MIYGDGDICIRLVNTDNTQAVYSWASCTASLNYTWVKGILLCLLVLFFKTWSGNR